MFDATKCNVRRLLRYQETRGGDAMDEPISATQATEQLFHMYKDELYRHALFTLGNPDDAG